MKPSKLVTIPEAAAFVGWNPQRLRRHLLRRERETGQRILVRVGEGTERVRYLVSLSVLKDYEPALFHGRRDAIAEAVRKAMAEFAQELSGMREEIAQLGANTAALRDRVDSAIPSGFRHRRPG